MKRRAVILAGGIGSRLRPYTVVMPKPLMPIGEYPILELVIKQLGKNNFDHITLCVNHQANLFRTFFGDGSKWNIKIDYSEEKETLGTMGPLKLINDLPENFLVMNGDILTDLDYSNFYTKHENNKDIFTISSHIREHKVDYGVLNSNENNYLEGFTEKPMQSYLVSMGIYMLSKSVLNYIPNGTFGFDQLMLKLIQSGEHVKVEEFGGYWLDIGRPDDYMQAIDDFESMKKIFI